MHRIRNFKLGNVTCLNPKCGYVLTGNENDLNGNHNLVCPKCGEVIYHRNMVRQIKRALIRFDQSCRELLSQKSTKFKKFTVAIFGIQARFNFICTNQIQAHVAQQAVKSMAAKG